MMMSGLQFGYLHKNYSKTLTESCKILQNILPDSPPNFISYNNSQKHALFLDTVWKSRADIINL